MAISKYRTGATHSLAYILGGAKFNIKDAQSKLMYFTEDVKGNYHYTSNQGDRGAVSTIISKAKEEIILLDLPKGNYVCEEVAAPSGYLLNDSNTKTFKITTGASIELVYENKFDTEARTIDIVGTKRWVGDKVPDSVDIGLYADGVLTDKTPIWSKNGNIWTYTYTGLDKYDSNNIDITYTVKEGNIVSGVFKPASNSIRIEDDLYTIEQSGYTITNTFEHTINHYKITVNYYDEDGHAIKSAYVSPNMEEDTYYDVMDKDKLQIEGYIYDTTTGDALKGLLDKNKVINVYYREDKGIRHKATVNYYDQDCNVISTQYVSEAQVENTPYDVTAYDKIAIEGYTYNKTNGDTLTGSLDEDKIINVYYIADTYVDTHPDEYVVKVNYYDENSNVINEQYITQPVAAGNAYDVTAYTNLDIEGYIWYRVLGDSITGSLDTDKIINVYYKKKPVPPKEYNITVNYYDEAGNIIHPQYVSDKVVEGSTYDARPEAGIAIKDYTYSNSTGANVQGTLDGDKVINCYYTRNKYTVTVNYYDNSGNVIYTKYVTVPAISGTEYDVTAYVEITIDGYTYKMHQGDDIKGILDGNKVIDVYFLYNTTSEDNKNTEVTTEVTTQKENTSVASKLDNTPDTSDPILLVILLGNMALISTLIILLKK